MYHTSIGRKAFTLLELMIAFVIMAILSAVAVPSLLNVVNGDQQTGDNASAIAATSAYVDSQFATGNYNAPLGSSAATGITAPPGATLSAGAATNSVIFTFPKDQVCVDLHAGGATPTLGTDCGISSGSITTTTATTGPGWGAVLDVATTLSGVQPFSITCTAVGDCTVGGLYVDASGNTQAYVQSETSGTWGSPQTLATSLNVNNFANVTSVTCSSPGNCVAGGYYTDSAWHTQAFIAVETSGTWGTAQQVGGSPNVGGTPNTRAVSCLSATDCVGAVQSLESDGRWHAFVAPITNGTWGTGQEIAANLNNNNGFVQTVSCTSDGNCVAGGSVNVSSSEAEGYIAVESGGTWQPATAVTGTLSTTAGSVQSIGCSSAGNCVADGSYNGSGSGGFVMVETSGVWGSPQVISLAGGTYTTPSRVYCAAAGTFCAVGGTYTDSSGFNQAFLVSETSGVWGSAQEIAATQNAGGFAQVGATWCNSSSQCTATGSYSDVNGNSIPFVTNYS